VAFKAEELMTQVSTGRWKACQGRAWSGEDLLMCDQDSQRNNYCLLDSHEPCQDPTRPPCQQDSQHPCQQDSQHPCRHHTRRPCEDDTRKTPCDLDTQGNKVPSKEAGSSGLALLHHQMRELLSSGQAEAGI
jgi:hypothetical protein